MAAGPWSLGGVRRGMDACLPSKMEMAGRPSLCSATRQAVVAAAVMLRPLCYCLCERQREGRFRPSGRGRSFFPRPHINLGPPKTKLGGTLGKLHGRSAFSAQLCPWPEHSTHVGHCMMGWRDPLASSHVMRAAERTFGWRQLAKLAACSVGVLHWLR
jgi:hypothetical protein